MANMRAAELGRDILPQSRRAELISCGRILTYIHTADLAKSKLETGFFCRNRLCPACAWRKSVHDATEIACILQRAVDDGFSLHFATLTAKSVYAEDLREAVDDYLRAYWELMRLAPLRWVQGGLRKLEITYNKEKCWYHPHIHAVWLAKKRRPLSTEQITDLWRQSLRNKYIVDAQAQDIRAVRSAERSDVLEFAKYPAKSGDYLQNKRTFETFYEALHGQRLITYTKKARDYKRMYKAGILDEYKGNGTINEYIYRSLWDWCNDLNEYVQRDIYEMPEAQKEPDTTNFDRGDF